MEIMGFMMNMALLKTIIITFLVMIMVMPQEFIR